MARELPAEERARPEYCEEKRDAIHPIRSLLRSVRLREAADARNRIKRTRCEAVRAFSDASSPQTGARAITIIVIDDSRQRPPLRAVAIWL